MGTTWGRDLGLPRRPAAEVAAEEMRRRTFLAYVAAGLSAFVTTVVGLPAIGYLAAPLARKETANWLSLGNVDTFKVGEPRRVAISMVRQDGWRRITESRTCWVLAGANDQYTVFNGRCTHLGCAYSLKTDGPYTGKFFCPCHDGVYDLEGKVLAGPPPRALDRLETRVEGGVLMVLYQDYRLGVEGTEPA